MMAQKGYIVRLGMNPVYAGDKVTIPSLSNYHIRDVECGILVLKIIECIKCDGKGKLKHPEWMEFYNKYKQLSLPQQIKKAKAFWKKKGKTTQKSWPEQEIICDHCNGKQMYAWSILDLQTLLKSLSNVLNNIGRHVGIESKNGSKPFTVNFELSDLEYSKVNSKKEKQ